jgi:transposase
MRRTAVVNQIRALLLERGITVRMGRCHLDAALTSILEDGSTSLSGALRFLLIELKQEPEQLAGHIEQAEALIQRAAAQSEACQRLDAIPGIGPLTVTALIAAIGNGGAFRRGGSSQPGSDWFPANIPPEASRSCSASASAATFT